MFMVQGIEKERASERAQWQGDPAPRGELEPLPGQRQSAPALAAANGSAGGQPRLLIGLTDSAAAGLSAAAGHSAAANGSAGG